MKQVCWCGSSRARRARLRSAAAAFCGSCNPLYTGLLRGLRCFYWCLSGASAFGPSGAFVRGERREQSKKSCRGQRGQAMSSNGTNGGARMMEQENVTEDCISERRLWTAVVVTAVEDWRNGTLRARREAQSFLFEDDADFQAVCASAGLDPATLRARLVKIGQRVHMHGPYFQRMAA